MTLETHFGQSVGAFEQVAKNAIINQVSGYDLVASMNAKLSQMRQQRASSGNRSVSLTQE